MNGMLRLLAVPLRKYKLCKHPDLEDKYILSVFMDDGSRYDTVTEVKDNMRQYNDSNLPT